MEISSVRGAVTLSTGEKARIPEDTSILNIFTHNKFINKANYKDDGYVYIGKRKIKKWYKKIEGVLVWFPTLNDVHRLQDRWKKVMETRKNYFCCEYRKAVNQLKKVKIAHFNSKGDWRYYHCRDGGIGWEYAKIDEKPVNVKIGTHYHKINERMDELGRRSWMFKKVLEKAIYNHVWPIKGEFGNIVRVKVDDLYYWYIFKGHGWEKMDIDERFREIEI